MASNSDTALATQQSIKAYVDAQQDTVDTFAEILALSNTTGGTDLSVSTNDKVQFRDAAIYINSSTDGQLDIVADTEIQLAATTVDLNGVLDVSGNIVVGGTVDGRDIASDGTKLDGFETKLDGIEASATADQSNAEIRAAVEAATDSNVFTDADHTKLNGIEASATADQSNAEIRSAVEAATDSNVFTDADHTKLNGIEASATADQSNAEIRSAVEAATDSNVFTDADHTKLNGIEASATADQSNAEIRSAVEAATDSNVFTDADHTKLNGVAANATANVGDITNVITGNGLSGGGTSGEVTVAVDTSIVVTKNDTQTLTNKTLTSPDINTPDIDGGTIDGATIGATTPAAGTFSGIVSGTTASTQLNIKTSLALNTATTIKNDTNLSGWSYTGKTLDINTEQPVATGVYLADSGRKLYITGSNGDFIDRYELSTPYDVTSAGTKTVSGNVGDTNPQDLVIADSGTKAYILGTQNDVIRHFTLGAGDADPYDITSWSLANAVDITSTDNSPTGFDIKADGTKVWIVGTQNDSIYQFTMSTPFDISTIGNLVTYDLTADNINNPTGISVSADGSRLHVLGQGGDDITRYDLSTAHSIASSSITRFNNFYVGFEGIAPQGLWIDESNKIVLVVDSTLNSVQQYTTDANTAVLDTDNLFIDGSVYVNENLFMSGTTRFDGPFSVAGFTTLQGVATVGNTVIGNSAGTTATMGHVSGTNSVTVGRSTKTQTVSIHDAVTESGQTATVNIGTSGASGSTTNINIGGGVGTCTTTIDADLVIPGETPASATAAGTAGQIAWDVNYIYICTATNTWKRVAIGTW
tara:strand:- start:4237 stop:6690 length:2454 start_codon:yes stop_codon:yes gene_type:complete